jgi:hypothetical protein
MRVLHRDGFAFFLECDAEIFGLFGFSLELEQIRFGILRRDIEILTSFVDDILLDTESPGDLDAGRCPGETDQEFVRRLQCLLVELDRTRSRRARHLRRRSSGPR